MIYLKAHLAKLGLDLVEEHRFHPKRKWRFDYAIPEKKIAIEVENKIRASYFPILAQLHDCFKQMANE